MKVCIVKFDEREELFIKEQIMTNNEIAPEFVIKAPFMGELINEIKSLRAEVETIKEKMNPKQELFDLKEACILKGVSYGSLATAKYKHLQPNRGKPDVIVCGRSRWKWETVQPWLRQSDEDLENMVEA
jgi:hypothetical protein